MAVKIIVNGYGGQHDLDVKSAFLMGYALLGDTFNDNIELRAESLTESFLYAEQNETKIIIRSTTGASGYIGLQKTYYPIQLIMPAGSNDYVQIFNTNGNLPAIILTGAGDFENETGYDIEFYSNDPMSVEPTDLSSYANGFIAGALYYIAKQTDGNIWTARYLLRQALGNNWNNINGYGKIDANAVTNAISLYDEQIDYANLDIYLSVEEETTNNLQGDTKMENKLTRFLDAFDLPKEMSKDDIAALVSIIKPYKVYTALLSQSNTNNPTVTILENTIGDIVWSRGGEGYFTATLAGAFTVGKTICFSQRSPADNYGREIKVNRNIGGFIEMWQQVTSTGAMVDTFTGLQIEIRVYP